MKNKELSATEAEANKLGLSYGVYVAYKETGYLDTYISRRNEDLKKKPPVHVYESNLIGGRKSVRIKNRQDRKV